MKLGTAFSFLLCLLASLALAAAGPLDISGAEVLTASNFNTRVAEAIDSDHTMFVRFYLAG
jgi:hypothetical protein